MLSPRASPCLLLTLAEASGGVLVMAGKGADRTANIRQHVFKCEFSCEMPSKEMPSQKCVPEMPLYHMRHICLGVSSSACSSQSIRCGIFVIAYQQIPFFPIQNTEVVDIFRVPTLKKNKAVGTTPRDSRRCEAVNANHLFPWICMKSD